MGRKGNVVFILELSCILSLSSYGLSAIVFSLNIDINRKAKEEKRMEKKEEKNDEEEENLILN